VTSNTVWDLNFKSQLKKDSMKIILLEGNRTLSLSLSLSLSHEHHTQNYEVGRKNWLGGLKLAHLSHYINVHLLIFEA